MATTTAGVECLRRELEFICQDKYKTLVIKLFKIKKIKYRGKWSRLSDIRVRPSRNIEDAKY